MTVTRQIAEFAQKTRLEEIPDVIRHHARRSLLNYVGCACGGANHPTVLAAHGALETGRGPAAIIGREVRTTPAVAALLNGMSSAIYSFDDTHAQALVHPSGPVASAMIAQCAEERVSGAEFLRAFIFGVELACRASIAISVDPARGRPEWLQTSVCGGVGAALACALLKPMSTREIASAIGLAASQASGLRGLSKSSCFSFVAGTAARAGFEGARLAQSGLDGPEEPLNGAYGFLASFSAAPNFGALVDTLGDFYELGRNTFKPFPCGVVIHPVIQACLEIETTAIAEIQTIQISVHPSVIKLGDLGDPKDQFEAQTSFQHWASSALIFRRAGINETKPEIIADPRVAALRARVELISKADLSRAAAEVTVQLFGGRSVTKKIERCIGSIDAPMSDQQLENKFLEQTAPVLGQAAASMLAQACWRLDETSNLEAIFKLIVRQTP